MLKTLKEDVAKEHFTIGSGPSHFNTTNNELMKSSSMPDMLDSNRHTRNKNKSKLQERLLYRNSNP